MRTYRSLVFAAVVAAAATVAGQSPSLAAGAATVVSLDDVYISGMQNYKKGAYKAAVRDLKHASDGGVLLADFYLARIYENKRSGLHNRLEAFLHYKRVADALFDIDPDNDPRIRFAGQALTAVARYVRDGIPELNIPPNMARAAKFFRHAAVFFREDDAKFELAKMQLEQAKRAGQLQRNARYVRLAVNDLSELSRNGHAGAQAYLASLLWHGKFVREDRIFAYSLATVAAESLADGRSDDRRVSWILKIHRDIYCSAPRGLRERARSTMAWLKRNYAHSDDRAPGGKIAVSVASPGELSEQSCQNGRPAFVYRPAMQQAGVRDKVVAKEASNKGRGDGFALSGASPVNKAKP